MNDMKLGISTFPSDELLFAAEQEPALSRAVPGWKLLIVDDEEEGHVITRMVLEGLAFSGKGLTFLSAYSGAPARDPRFSGAVHAYPGPCFFEALMTQPLDLSAA